MAGVKKIYQKYELTDRDIDDAADLWNVKDDRSQALRRAQGGWHRGEGA